MPTIELQQVKCPNCGANISQFNRFRQTLECPYCHSTLQNPEAYAVKRDMPQPEFIIPFKTADYDFGKNLLQALVKRKYVPTDIFTYMRTEDVFKAFLPMFLYDGNYTASWNGHVDEKYQENNETKTRRRYVNGNANGTYSFMCLAYEGEEVPKELREFAKLMEFDHSNAQYFSPDVFAQETDDFMTVEVNVEKLAVWSHVGEQELQRQVDEGVHRAAGSDVDDIQYTMSYTPNSDGRLVLVPFWFIYYNYRDERHHFIMDGLGQRRDLSAPVNMEEKHEINKYNWSMWSTLIVAFIGIIMLVAKVQAGSPVLIAGAVAFAAALIVYLVRRHNILSASEKIRDAGANLFLQQQQ